MVGRENEGWRFQRLRAEMLPVHREAVALEESRRRAEWNTVRFPGLMLSGDFRHPHSASVRTFTPAGPLKGIAKPLPHGLVHLAEVPGSPLRYGFASDHLVRFDTEAWKRTDIPFDADLPEVSWPTGVAFDAKRKRVMLITLGGVGHLYAYSVANKTWSVLADMGDDFYGLAYSPESDCFYSLLVQHASPVRIARFSPEGGRLPRRSRSPSMRAARSAPCGSTRSDSWSR